MSCPESSRSWFWTRKWYLFSCLCSQNAYIKSYSSFYDKYDRKSLSFSLIKNIISWKLHFPPVNSFDFNGFWSQMACIKWNNWPSHWVLTSPQFGKLGHRVKSMRWKSKHAPTGLCLFFQLMHLTYSICWLDFSTSTLA